jgi:predicted neutral ceramidase superfamily lipid hydrolase
MDALITFIAFAFLVGSYHNLVKKQLKHSLVSIVCLGVMWMGALHGHLHVSAWFSIPLAVVLNLLVLGVVVGHENDLPYMKRTRSISLSK